MKSATSHKTAPQPAESESESEATLRAKLAAVRKIGDERRRAKGIGALAPHLPEILLRDAFTAATEMAEESARAYAVRSLIAYLPKTLLREGLAVAKEMKDASYCYDVLAGLVQRLPKMLLPEALDVALGIPEECWRNGAVEAIAEHAPKKWLHDALIKALLRKAPATNSPIENSQETSHKKLVLDRPDIGDAALEQRQSEFVRLAKEIGLATAGKLIVEAASPDERAHIASMAACVREVTSPEPPPAPVAARTPFREALEAMTLKDRRSALIQHYGLLPDKDGKYALPEEKKWETVRGGKNPPPEKFLTWLNEVFPDRREIGMVLSDLKHLDEAAYDKVMLWAGARSKMPRAVIDSFGLPSRITKYDPERDANAPRSWAEVHERAKRGEDSFKNLQRTFARVQPHL